MAEITHVLDSDNVTPCGLDPNFRWPDDHNWISTLRDNLKPVDCWRCIAKMAWKLIPREPPCPNHEKHKATGELTQKLCEFIKEFLPHKGVFLAEEHHHSDDCRDGGGARICGMRNDEMYPARQDVVRLAAEFAGIDFNAYQAEKDALLRYVRQMNALRDWCTGEGKKLLLEGRTVKIRCRHCGEAVKQLDWHGNFAHVADDPSCTKAQLTQEGDDVYEELPRCDKPVKGLLCDEEPGHGGQCHSHLFRKAR